MIILGSNFLKYFIGGHYFLPSAHYRMKRYSQACNKPLY